MLTLGHLNINEEKKETVVYFSIAQMTTGYAKLHTIKKIKHVSYEMFWDRKKNPNNAFSHILLWNNSVSRKTDAMAKDVTSHLYDELPLSTFLLQSHENVMCQYEALPLTYVVSTKWKYSNGIKMVF